MVWVKVSTPSVLAIEFLKLLHMEILVSWFVKKRIEYITDSVALRIKYDNVCKKVGVMHLYMVRRTDRDLSLGSYID